MRTPNKPANYIFIIELHSEECRTVVTKLIDKSLEEYKFACFFKKDLKPSGIDLTPEIPKIAITYKNYYDAHGVFCHTDNGNHFSTWAIGFVESLPKQYWKVARFSKLYSYGEGWVKKADADKEETKTLVPEQPENKITEIPMP